MRIYVTPQEPISLFVMLYNDLSMGALSEQAVFARGGACSLEAGAGAAACVRIDLALGEEERAAAQHLMDLGASDAFALAFTGHATLTVCVRVPEHTSAARAADGWNAGADVDAAVRASIASWAEPDSALAAVFALRAPVILVRAQPAGWLPESGRIHLHGLGEFARFLIEHLTLAALDSTRPDGAAPCLRRTPAGDCMDVLDAKACAAVRRALVEAELICTGRDGDAGRRGAELGVAYPEAVALTRRDGGEARAWSTQVTRSNLVCRIVKAGGTLYPFDGANVLTPLRTFNADFLHTKTEAGAETGKYKYWQFDLLPDGPIVVAIPGAISLFTPLAVGAPPQTP